VADVVITSVYTPRKNSKKTEQQTIRLEKVPVVLHEGKFPTKKMEKKFMRRVFDNHIKTGDFNKTTFKVKEIKNIKLLSGLAYKFDYDKH
jgi:hypothetical protein